MNKVTKYRVVLAFISIVCLVFQSGVIGYASELEEISETMVDDENINSQYEEIWDSSRYEILWNVDIYYGLFMDKFAQKLSIPDMISEQERWKLVIDHLEGDTMIVATDGSTAGTMNESKWRTLLMYMVSPDLLFGDTITVHNGYCLHGQGSFVGVDDWYVYYETDIGDYVLYVHAKEIDHLYLVPLPVMQEYTRSVLSHMSEIQSTWKYYSPAVIDEDLKLIASYEIDSPDYLPPAPSDFELPVSGLFETNLSTQTTASFESDYPNEQTDFTEIFQKPYLYLSVLFVLFIVGFNIWLFKKMKE